MSAKRMFSNAVIDSDAFFMLSAEAQLLYFHLGLKADDDGFVAVKRICRILGLDEKPLRELEDAGFLIAFEDGVVVIVHWKLNNELKKDRYHESRYTSYKKRLRLNENGEYFLAEPDWNRDGTVSPESIAQVSPVQESIAYASPAQPTLTEVQAYCREKGLPADAEAFFETMERQGWKSKDGRRVEDWKALLLTWGRGRERDRRGPKQVSAQMYTQRDYTEEELLAISDDLVEEARRIYGNESQQENGQEAPADASSTA